MHIFFPLSWWHCLLKNSIIFPNHILFLWHIFLFNPLKCNIPIWPLMSAFVQLVCWSVCHNYPKGQEVTLPCSYHSSCSMMKHLIHFLHWFFFATHAKNLIGGFKIIPPHFRSPNLSFYDRFCALRHNLVVHTEDIHLHFWSCERIRLLVTPYLQPSRHSRNKGKDILDTKVKTF